jgi:hypothetical protein
MYQFTDVSEVRTAYYAIALIMEAVRASSAWHLSHSDFFLERLRKIITTQQAEPVSGQTFFRVWSRSAAVNLNVQQLPFTVCCGLRGIIY